LQARLGAYLLRVSTTIQIQNKTFRKMLERWKYVLKGRGFVSSLSFNEVFNLAFRSTCSLIVTYIQIMALIA
jgi:hypothetical protein